MQSNSMSNLGHFKDSILLQKAQGVQNNKNFRKTSDVSLMNKPQYMYILSSKKFRIKVFRFSRISIAIL